MKRFLLMPLLLILAACGGGEDEIILPTNTPDPLAFFAPTPMSPGRPENPLRVVFIPPDPEVAAQAATTLAGELSSRSGLAIEVVNVATPAEALSMLCDYNDEDRYAAPWLNGPTTILAIAKNCGDVVLQGVRGGSTGLAGEVVGTGGNLASLRGRTFCRLGVRDFYSWVLPTLEMEANNVEMTELGQVSDYIDYDILFSGITDGTCAATGIPAGLFDTDEYSEYAQRFGTIATTPPMPYGILMYPPELLLADREALTEAFIEIAGVELPDPEAGEEIPEPVIIELNQEELTTAQNALLALLGAEGVAPVTSADLAELGTYISDAGLVDLVR